MLKILIARLNRRPHLRRGLGPRLPGVRRQTVGIPNLWQAGGGDHFRPRSLQHSLRCSLIRILRHGQILSAAHRRTRKCLTTISITGRLHGPAVAERPGIKRLPLATRRSPVHRRVDGRLGGAADCWVTRREHLITWGPP